jgi:hypothetical protein
MMARVPQNRSGWDARILGPVKRAATAGDSRKGLPPTWRAAQQTSRSGVALDAQRDERAIEERQEITAMLRIVIHGVGGARQTARQASRT